MEYIYFRLRKSTKIQKSTLDFRLWLANHASLYWFIKHPLKFAGHKDGYSGPGTPSA